MLSSKKTKAQLTEDLAARDAQIADLNNQLTEMAFHAHEVEDDLKKRYEEDLVRAEELASASDQRDELVETIEELEFLLDNAYEQQVELADDLSAFCSIITWVYWTTGSAEAYRGNDAAFVGDQLAVILRETADVALAFAEVGEERFGQGVMDLLQEESEEALVQHWSSTAHWDDIPTLGLSEDIFSEGGLTDTVAVDLPDVEVEDDLSQVALNALAWLYADEESASEILGDCDDLACRCHALSDIANAPIKHAD